MNKGFKHSAETKKKISDARKGKKMGCKNINWLGVKASKNAKHRWVEYHKGKPNKCEHCRRIDKKRYEWANKDHKYLRNLSDYIRLCVSCHQKYDIKHNGWMDHGTRGSIPKSNI